jgi:hypothetical protein
MRLALLGLLAATATACAHAPAPEFSRRIRQARCEDAVSFLRAHPRGPPVESRLKQVVTVPLSYVLTGVGYTAEIAVVVGGGIVLSGVVCTPVLALEGAARGSGEASADCFASMLGTVFADASLPGVGRGIHAATRGWRCADMSPVSEDLRAIARCYAERGGDGDLERARQQLDVLVRSTDLLRCVSDEERGALDEELASVNERLDAASPSTARR